jgi:hypothetical protein
MGEPRGRFVSDAMNILGDSVMEWAGHADAQIIASQTSSDCVQRPGAGMGGGPDFGHFASSASAAIAWSEVVDLEKLTV